MFDVTGAGDTVIATLAVMLAAGAGLEAAMRIANRAAGIVVGKLGTAAATPAELFGHATDLEELTVLRRHRRRRLHRLQAGRGAQPARHHRDHRGRQPASTVGDKFRNLAGCEIADYLDQAEFLAELDQLRRRGRGGVPPGRLLRHHGDRRPLHDGEQLRLLQAAARVVPGGGGAAPLRLVGRGLRRAAGVPRGARAARRRSTSTATPSSCSTSGARRCCRGAPRRSPGCATSTSTARTRRTRGAWPRSPPRLHQFQARRQGEAVRRLRRLRRRRAAARLRLRRRRGGGEPLVPRARATSRASSTAAPAARRASTTSPRR